MRFFLLTFLLFGLNVSAKEIYTCKVNGSTIYQGKPCAGSKEQANKIKEKQSSYKQAEDRENRETAEWNARKEPSIGMTTTQVGNSTFGYPQRYSETQTANGQSEFWHYDSGKMVYFRNGKVVSITR